MAGVGGVFNAVCVHASHVGEIVLTGQGAGRMPTTSAVLSDIARVALGTYQTDFAAISSFGDVPDAQLMPFGDLETRYYFRLHCVDRPGVLAKVAGVLGEEGISIASLRQHEVAVAEGDLVPVVFMTHQAREAAFARALARINRLDAVRGDATHALRVADI
jgi:homoserine dehydrogenase